MRVCITGAAGFIGSNLYAACLERGWDVTGVDDLSNGHVKFLPRLPPAQNDWGCHLLDFADQVVFDMVRVKKFDVVFHLAANPRVSYSVEHPVETHETNVTKTLQLIDACKGNVRRLVFASSSAVYGESLDLPTDESDRKAPRSPYGLQKSIIEDYLQMYWTVYGLDSTCLRFFNVFGKNQLGGSPYATAVSSWLTAIKKGEPLRSDGDGEQSRDMCHVDNVTHACVMAAEKLDLLRGQCINVACGERVTNNEILEYLTSRYPSARVITAPARVGDVRHTLANISTARRVLGYEPRVKFWEGLDMTIKWTEENWDTIKELELNK